MAGRGAGKVEVKVPRCIEKNLQFYSWNDDALQRTGSVRFCWKIPPKCQLDARDYFRTQRAFSSILREGIVFQPPLGPFDFVERYVFPRTDHKIIHT